MPPPDRWEQYTPIGKTISGTKFIPFKVPLKQALCANLPEDQKFTPTHLVQHLSQKLGLVIDLTFTYKYYNPKELMKYSIQHEKIFTLGHEVPNEDVYERFKEVVDNFAAKNADCDSGDLIGVHCTHGVNRTGYLICRYMVEEMKILPDIAIKLFNEARGHKIERDNYISDLKKRPLPSTASKRPTHKPGNDGDKSRNGSSASSRPSHSQPHPAKCAAAGYVRNAGSKRPFRNMEYMFHRRVPEGSYSQMFQHGRYDGGFMHSGEEYRFYGLGNPHRVAGHAGRQGYGGWDAPSNYNFPHNYFGHVASHVSDFRPPAFRKNRTRFEPNWRRGTSRPKHPPIVS